MYVEDPKKERWLTTSRSSLSTHKCAFRSLFSSFHVRHLSSPLPFQDPPFLLLRIHDKRATYDTYFHVPLRNYFSAIAPN
jgi:hypothetical protein